MPDDVQLYRAPRINRCLDLIPIQLHAFTAVPLHALAGGGMCSLALHAACTASIVAALALTTGSSAQPQKSSLVHSGTPPWVGAPTDCAIRELAWRFGKTLQPSRGEFRSLFDALQLDLCGIAPPPHVHE